MKALTDMSRARNVPDRLTRYVSFAPRVRRGNRGSGSAKCQQLLVPTLKACLRESPDILGRPLPTRAHAWLMLVRRGLALVANLGLGRGARRRIARVALWPDAGKAPRNGIRTIEPRSPSWHRGRSRNHALSTRHTPSSGGSFSCAVPMFALGTPATSRLGRVNVAIVADGK